MEGDVKEMETESVTEASKPRVYELGYLVISSISEEDLPREIGVLRDQVEKAGARVISEQFPKSVELAYNMVKSVSNVRTNYNRAYFGWFGFELGQASTNDLEDSLKANDKILRFLLIKTTKEALMPEPARRRVFAEKPAQGVPTEPMPKKEMDVVAVDKEIEALVS